MMWMRQKSGEENLLCSLGIRTDRASDNNHRDIERGFRRE